MSFRTIAKEFDISKFKLEASEKSSPRTGIKINLDAQNSFEEQSTFRFTDKTASKDATLADIVLSTGNKEESQNYKEYSYTPEFKKEELNYELKLYENIEKIDLTAILSDTNANMKVKVPKRDEKGELEYETDGTTIIYEEKEIQNNMPNEITLNKLTEPETEITIIVTAEDGKNKQEYKIVIKRTYGILKGSIFTEPTQKTTKVNKADIKIYTKKDTEETINWDVAINNSNSGSTDKLHEQLTKLKEIEMEETKDDGSYEIVLIPGEYVVLVDKPGYLDHIYLGITINENEDMDLGKENLIAGDINKNGMVEILDKVIMTKQNGKAMGDNDFNIACDINNDNEVSILDKTVLTKNNAKKREIIDYRGDKK